jgi:hypothetical protein
MGIAPNADLDCGFALAEVRSGLINLVDRYDRPCFAPDEKGVAFVQLLVEKSDFHVLVIRLIWGPLLTQNAARHAGRLLPQRSIAIPSHARRSASYRLS